MEKLAGSVKTVSIFLGIVAVISFGVCAFNFATTHFLGTYPDHDFTNDLPSENGHKL